MRVAIAGAGNVGLFIANDLVGAGHEVLLIEQNPARRRARRGRRRRRVARRRRVRGDVAARGRARDAATSSSPRPATTRTTSSISLLAKQEFARAPRHRPGEPPEERVAVQRELGRRPLGVDAAPHHRARRGGGVGRPPRAHPAVRGRPGPPRRGHARRRLAGRSTRRSRSSTSPATRPSSRSSASEHVVMPRGDTVFEAGDEVLAMVTAGSEDDVRQILTGGWTLSRTLERQRQQQLVDRGCRSSAALAVAGDDALEHDAAGPATCRRSCGGRGTRRSPTPRPSLTRDLERVGARAGHDPHRRTSPATRTGGGARPRRSASCRSAVAERRRAPRGRALRPASSAARRICAAPRFLLASAGSQDNRLRDLALWSADAFPFRALAVACRLAVRRCVARRLLEQRRVRVRRAQGDDDDDDEGGDRPAHTAATAIVASAGPTSRSTRRRSRPCSTRARSTSTPRCSRRCIDGAVGPGYDALFDRRRRGDRDRSRPRRAHRRGRSRRSTTSPTVTATPVRFDGLADAQRCDPARRDDVQRRRLRHHRRRAAHDPPHDRADVRAGPERQPGRSPPTASASRVEAGTRRPPRPPWRRSRDSPPGRGDRRRSTLLVVAAAGGLTAAWLAGVRVPVASGATYMEIQKLAAADAAGAPTNTFFIALGRQRLPAGCRWRPRRRAAPRRREPGHAHRDDAQHPARHLLARATRSTRAHAQAARAAWRTRSAASSACRSPTSSRSTSPGSRASSTAWAACRSTSRSAMDDEYSGAVFAPGDQRLNGAQALAFSRNRHDFPNSDITAHRQPGPADPRRAGAAADGKRTARSASSRLPRCSAATPQLDGMGLTDVYRLGRVAQRLEPGRGPQRHDPGRRRRLPSARRRRPRPVRRLRGRRHAPSPLTASSLPAERLGSTARLGCGEHGRARTRSTRSAAEPELRGPAGVPRAAARARRARFAELQQPLHAEVAARLRRARHRPRCSRTRPRRSTGCARDERRRRDRHRVGQVALLPGADRRVGRRRAARHRAADLPDQGARAGPAAVAAIVARARAARRHLRRRHRRRRPRVGAQERERAADEPRDAARRASSRRTSGGRRSSCGCATSSSTSCTRCAASSAATSRTCCAGCGGSASTTAPHPTFCFASATIGNPGELASALCGLPVDADRRRRLAARRDACSRAGSARCSTSTPGARASANVETADLLARFVRAGHQTLAFTRSRRGAELVAAARAPPARSRRRRAAGAQVAAYRAGYLPEERRELERDLSSGRLLGIAATNALELGIDVGGLDAVVLNGFPGTLASMWQQAGRAGRTGRRSAAVLVAGDDQLDQWYAAHPHELTHRAPEARGREPAEPVRAARRRSRAPRTSCPLAPDDERWFGDGLDDAVRDARARRPAEAARRAHVLGRRRDRRHRGVGLRTGSSVEYRLVDRDERAHDRHRRRRARVRGRASRARSTCTRAGSTASSELDTARPRRGARAVRRRRRVHAAAHRDRHRDRRRGRSSRRSARRSCTSARSR